MLRNGSKLSLLIVAIALVGACGPLQGLLGNKSSSSSSTTSETINGEPIDGDSRVGRAETQADKSTSDIGATCHKNDECDAQACWVGSGELGYCTKFCNSWSDCPSFWKCEKPGNAPQKICMQDD